MRKVRITRGHEVIVDNADYDRVIVAGPWHADMGRHTVYAARAVRKPDGKQTQQYLHRFLLGITDPKIHVDHANRNGLDNRRVNLRSANRSLNAANARKPMGEAASKFKGVSWHKRNRKWRAQIRVNGKKIHLGNFDSEIDAAVAYYRATCEHFGAFHSTAVAVTAR